jgi:uncharacterized membrane protein
VARIVPPAREFPHSPQFPVRERWLGMTEATFPISGGRGRVDRHAFARIAAVAVLALALSVLAGWWLEQPILRSGIAGLAAMNPLTAIGLVLASASLRLQLVDSRGPRALVVGRWCAVAIVLLALLCLTRLTP